MSRSSIGPETPPPWLGRRAMLVLGGLVVLAHAADGWAYEHLVDDRAFDIYAHLPDWKRFFRIAGYAPTWWVVAGLVLLCRERAPGPRPTRARPFHALVLATLMAVPTAVLVKLAVGRQRPKYVEGDWVHEPFAQWKAKGLSMPSSHALVAFAAAFVLAFAYRRAGWAFLLIAIGCGLGRVASRAHFLSDVAVAAALALPLAHLAWHLTRRRTIS